MEIIDFLKKSILSEYIQDDINNDYIKYLLESPYLIVDNKGYKDINLINLAIGLRALLKDKTKILIYTQTHRFINSIVRDLESKLGLSVVNRVAVISNPEQARGTRASFIIGYGDTDNHNYMEGLNCILFGLCAITREKEGSTCHTTNQTK